jgi:L-asparaginase / beta-aspartyl-peptidase
MMSVSCRPSRTFSFLFLAGLILSMHTQPTSAQDVQTARQEAPPQRFALVLHGGAGGNPANWTADYRAAKRQSLAAALDAGSDMLGRGAAALDVVEHVVRILEDDPLFNAGRGCVLNERGEHELDASIMDGSNLACGAVAGVRRVKNPITLARRVMTETPHVLLASHGAEEFAELQGLEFAPPEYFRTPEQIRQWEKWKASRAGRAQLERQQESGPRDKAYFGTVGCVAVDARGHIAAATSTGGLTGKRWGRVGDSPIVGAGTYANDASCGVSCTGTGEEFIRHHVAADLSARIRYASQSLDEAAAIIIGQVLPEDCGGLIAIDKSYNITMQFNTAAMARAAADSTGRREIRLERE